MMNYLVVDDEYPIREWLVFTIKKNFPAIAVDSADNGQEAITKLQTGRYDFLITDIQMPKLNGLELLQRVHTVSPSTKVIVLSSYDDYSYVRHAFKHMALDYLLKAEITEDQLVQLITAQQSQLLDTSSAQASKSIVIKYLQNRELTAEEFVRELNGVGLVLPDSDFFCYFIKVAAGGTAKATSGTASDSPSRAAYEFPLEPASENMIRIPTIKNLECVLSCDLSASTQLGIIHLKQRSRLMQLQDRSLFFNELKQYNSYALIMSTEVHRTSQDILGILRTLEDYRDVEFYGNNFYAISEDSGHWSDRFDQEYLKLLKDVKFQSWGDLEQSLNRFLSYAQAVCYPNIRQLKDTVEKLYEISYVYKTPKSARQYSQKLREASTLIADSTQFEELRATALEQFSSLYNKSEKNHLSPNIACCIDYIESNYMMDISLNDLAEFVHLNPEYLSRHFKKQTGTNFSSYLMAYRINKAALLIRETPEKIYEISLQVGFNNFAYFSKCFRDTYGCSPMEWRGGGQ